MHNAKVTAVRVWHGSCEKRFAQVTCRTTCRDYPHRELGAKDFRSYVALLNPCDAGLRHSKLGACAGVDAVPYNMTGLVLVLVIPVSARARLRISLMQCLRAFIPNDIAQSI